MADHATESPWVSKTVFFWGMGVMMLGASGGLTLHTHPALADKELMASESGHIREQLEASTGDLQRQINGVTTQIEKLDKKIDRFEERGESRHHEILNELRRPGR